MLKDTYNIFFNNLANKLKIQIITKLKEKEMSVNELANSLKVEQSKISHALSSLKSCNIVNSKQDGKLRIYSLNKKTIIPILNLIDEHSKSFCSGNCRACKK